MRKQTLFFLAPAGSGKTAHAIARIHQQRTSDPLAPIWVILPNFPQVIGFHRRRPGAVNCVCIPPLRSHRLHQSRPGLTR